MTISFSELLNQRTSWEIELTTRCQSRCVGCSRYSEYYHPNPFLNTKVELSLATLEKALKSTPQLEFVLLCGVYGDPLLHTRIVEVLELIRQFHPEVRISVHTNGSFGDENFWENLAPFFVTPGSHIKFALDGLEESHQAFRRGTHWQKTLKNAQVFMRAGGAAIWKMIEFNHNTEEVDQARELARSLGFKKFELRSNNFPGLDEYIQKTEDLRTTPSTVMGQQLDGQTLQLWNRSQMRGHEGKEVHCVSLERKNLYLDAHGNVWPCCWVGGLPSRPEHELRQWFQKSHLEKQPNKFNSLECKELSEILMGPWFSKFLPQSWKEKPEEADKLLSTCLKTCGRCQESCL